MPLLRKNLLVEVLVEDNPDEASGLQKAGIQKSGIQKSRDWEALHRRRSGQPPRRLAGLVLTATRAECDRDLPWANGHQLRGGR